MFITLISELNISTYLFVAFQLKDGCLKAGLPYLCLYASPELAVFPPEVGSASTYLFAITAVMTTWIAACVTTV